MKKIVFTAFLCLFIGESFATRFESDPSARVISVTNYGADPTGVADSTAAIQAAIAAAQATGIQYAGGLTTISFASVFFPEGVYKVDSAIIADTINAIQYTKFFGNKAQIVFAAGITGFGGIGTETHFEGLIFHGGAVAISIKTNNLGTTKITIENCIFVAQTVNCIQADDNSNSTLLNIDNCKFIENTTEGMHLLDTGSIDQTNMSRCWSSGSPAIPIEASGARFLLDNCMMIPRGITAWINQTGSVVRITNCIFSGEDGGGCFVDFRATGGILQIENCQLFTLDEAVRFYAMPTAFKWNNNSGNLGGFWFGPDLSQDDVNDVWANDSHYLIDGFRPLDSNDAELADIFMALTVNIKQTPSIPLDTDLKLLIPSYVVAYGLSTNSSNVTSTLNVEDPIFGIPCQTIEATADGGTLLLRYTTAMNGLAVGNYTFVRYIRVETESTLTIITRAGERTNIVRQFGHGYHVISMPFHFQTEETVGMTVQNMRIGDKVWWGPMRIYAGYHVVNTINDIRYGDTIPTTLQHYIGDRVINSIPGVGEPEGWQCIADGTPGAWVPYGMIQSANAYTTTNVSTNRTLNADGGDIAVVSDVLATLIEDLKTSGILKSP